MSWGKYSTPDLDFMNGFKRFEYLSKDQIAQHKLKGFFNPMGRCTWNTTGWQEAWREIYIAAQEVLDELQ